MSSARPGRLLTWVFRAPSRLYDWHAGWLLGGRFLRLTHTGRRSGKSYRTVLEVVGSDPGAGEVMVVAGFGRRADWYRNLRAGGPAEVEIGRRHFAPVHRDLDLDRSIAVFTAYERRNRLITPIVRRVLSKLVGWRYDGSDAARRRLAEELPVIALRPASEHDELGDCGRR